MLPRLGQQAGFTLIEFIVSLTLGLSLVSGVLVMFVHTNRSMIQDEEVARVLENGRFLMRLLSRELAMAGFWGKFIEVDTISIHPSVTVGQDCGDNSAAIWAVALVPLQFLDNVRAAEVANSFECLPGASVRVDTDIIATKRTMDTETGDSAIVENQIYLRTDAGRAELFLGGGEDTPPLLNGAESNWALMSQVFYLRDYSVNPGDNIPTFCRAFLNTSAPPDMRNECLVEGVENLQFEIGIDTDDDWIANFYDSNPTSTEILNAVSLRIHVLVRSVNIVPGYSNDKTYSLGATQVGLANDGYYRRVFSSTALLRNPAELVAIDSSS